MLALTYSMNPVSVSTYMRALAWCLLLAACLFVIPVIVTPAVLLAAGQFVGCMVGIVAAACITYPRTAVRK